MFLACSFTLPLSTSDVYRFKVMDGDSDIPSPKLEADTLAVSVTVKGYRSYWQWIQPESSEGLIRIRLEKWASARK